MFLKTRNISDTVAENQNPHFMLNKIVSKTVPFMR